MSRLTRDGTAEPVSRGKILRRERGQGNIHFPCSADHEQDWQPYPVDPYSCYIRDHTYIYVAYIQVHTYILYRARGVYIVGDVRFYPTCSSAVYVCVAVFFNTE